MLDLYRTLAWLPRPPTDLRAQCRALGQDDIDAVALRNLAGTALDLNQLVALAKRLRTATRRPNGLDPLRLGIVGNGTNAFLAAALVATAPRHGLWLDVIESGFDQAAQEILDPASELSRAKPDAVLFAFDHRGLKLTSSAADGDGRAASAADFLGQLRARLRARGCVSIVQTAPPPPEMAFGSFERRLSTTTAALVRAFNDLLAASLAGSGDLLLDTAALAETVGLAAWHDPGGWAVAKMPFAQDFLPLYADHVCRLLAAWRGRSRRCLVLDLDNTLWGGVIGDDGLAGLVLGEGNPLGEAFLAVQRCALDLRRRGIVLAVASKNDDAVARAPFRQHPDMLLREEHIAVFQANWQDKAANLRAIASALSLGLGSLVLLDDNPAERALVRRLVPEVAVPELPDDPALYTRTLLAGGYFEAVSFSEEDRRRAGYYESNARRIEIAAASDDLDTFLASLEMTATLAPFDAAGRSRIAQLVNKSNQFNLTTRRYGEAEIARLERDPDAFTLQVRLADRFGDNGMVSVVICRIDGDTWEIDTWLMSCRVLKRRLEEAVLDELAQAARAAGARCLVGRYIPTTRNGMVADHYAKLGFTLVETGPDGSTRWRLDLAEASPRCPPIRVVRPSGPPAILRKPHVSEATALA